MFKLIDFLKRRRAWCAALVGAYSVAVIAAHDLGQDAVFAMQDAVGAKRWLAGVAVAFAAIGVALIWRLVAGVRRRSDAAVLVAYGLATLLLAFSAYALLMMVSNECIHFVQYAILAVLVYPLTRRFGETIAWCTLIGTIDEGYQYFWLHRSWGYVYFDFNDVVLNLIGAACGVVALRALLPQGDERLPLAQHLRRPGYLAVGAAAAVSVIMLLAGWMRILPPEDASVSAIVLRRVGPATSFWDHPNLGKPFHQLQPWETAVIIGLLLTFYLGLDVLRGAPRVAPVEDLPPGALADALDGEVG